MKKTLVIVLALFTLFTCACSNSDGKAANSFKLTQEVLVAEDGNQKVEFPYNARVTITDGVLETIAFGGEKLETFEGDFKINGVGIGDKYEDFINAFGVEDEMAMWETYVRIDDEQILCNYPTYSESDEKIDLEKFDDVFFTIGFYIEDPENVEKDKEEANDESVPGWETMEYTTLSSVWNLELQQYEEDEIEEICIISAGIDEDGVINMLDVYYGLYEEYDEKETYREETAFFGNNEAAAVEENNAVESADVASSEAETEEAVEE